MAINMLWNLVYYAFVLMQLTKRLVLVIACACNCSKTNSPRLQSFSGDLVFLLVVSSLDLRA